MAFALQSSFQYINISLALAFSIHVMYVIGFWWYHSKIKVRCLTNGKFWNCSPTSVKRIRHALVIPVQDFQNLLVFVCFSSYSWNSAKVIILNCFSLCCFEYACDGFKYTCDGFKYTMRLKSMNKHLFWGTIWLVVWFLRYSSPLWSLLLLLFWCLS